MDGRKRQCPILICARYIRPFPLVQLFYVVLPFIERSGVVTVHVRYTSHYSASVVRKPYITDDRDNDKALQINTRCENVSSDDYIQYLKYKNFVLYRHQN